MNQPVLDVATLIGYQGFSSVSTPVLEGTLDYYLCADTVEPFEPPFPNGCALGQGDYLGSVVVNGAGSYDSPQFVPTQKGYYCFRSEFTPADGSPFPIARETNAELVGSTAECIVITDPTSIRLTGFEARSSTGRPVALAGAFVTAFVGGLVYFAIRRRRNWPAR